LSKQSSANLQPDHGRRRSENVTTRVSVAVLRGVMTQRTTRRTVLLGALLCAGLLAAPAAQTPVQATPPATLSVAGPTNANASLAAKGTLVAAVWAASLPSGVADIYAAVSRDAGATFGQPLRVNARVGDAHVTGEQPPRVAVRSKGNALPEIDVVWTSKNDL